MAKLLSVVHGIMEDWQKEREAICNSCSRNKGGKCGDSCCDKDKVKKKIMSKYSRCPEKKW